MIRRTSKQLGRRGLSFCYAVVLLGAMLVLGSVFLHVGLNSAKWAYSGYRGQQALYLAEAGVDRAMWMMEAGDSGEGGINDALAVTEAEAAGGATRTYTSATWELPTGAYSFTATAPHDGIAGVVAVHSVGIAESGEREDIMTVVYPEANNGENGGMPILPDCYGYAMFSDHNLRVNGNPSVLGGGGLYANGDIIFNGEASEIHGPISATRQIYGTCLQVPSDAGWYEGADRLSMPEIDMQWFKDNCDEYFSSTGFTVLNGGFAGSLDYNDPTIIYAEGKVKLSGNFTGVGIIVAKKGIEVTGNCTYNTPAADGWAFLTPGYFKITGTAQVHGLIYCHNAAGDAEFIGHGTPNIFGGVVADVITVTGSYTVEKDGYASGIPVLPGTTYYEGPPVIETLYWERT